jgi:hypothetical protein
MPQAAQEPQEPPRNLRSDATAHISSPLAPTAPARLSDILCRQTGAVNRHVAGLW